jgi:hypothetical protein
MSYAKSIAEKIAALPPERQAEIFDFVEFIVARYGGSSSQGMAQCEWTDDTFAALSMQQALRGMEDEPVIYTSNDLKERWL